MQAVELSYYIGCPCGGNRSARNCFLIAAAGRGLGVRKLPRGAGLKVQSPALLVRAGTLWRLTTSSLPDLAVAESSECGRRCRRQSVVVLR